MGDEKRKSERHKVRFHLVYDDGSSYNAGTVHDVSEGGMFLETALPLPAGTEVRLTPLDASGDTLFEVQAKVVHSVPYDAGADADQSRPSGMGLQFVGLSADERKNVVAMIRALEDRAAREGGAVDPFLGVRVPTSRPQGQGGASSP